MLPFSGSSQLIHRVAIIRAWPSSICEAGITTTPMGVYLSERKNPSCATTRYWVPSHTTMSPATKSLSLNFIEYLKFSSLSDDEICGKTAVSCAEISLSYFTRLSKNNREKTKLCLVFSLPKSQGLRVKEAATPHTREKATTEMRSLSLRSQLLT